MTVEIVFEIRGSKEEKEAVLMKIKEQFFYLTAQNDVHNLQIKQLTSKKQEETKKI